MKPIAFLMSGVLMVNDTRLAALGFLSNILAGLSIGLINSPLGLYIMYAIGGASCLCWIGIRSLLSKLVTEAESGKVFSLLAALETIMPTVNTLFCNLSEITTNQLIQDKICLNRYNQSVDYCVDISKVTTTTTATGAQAINATSVVVAIKDSILGDLARFNIYTVNISTLPAFFYVLFIGSWTDSYVHGRKLVLLLSSLSYIGMFAGLLFNSIYFDLDIYYILLSYIPSALSGGWPTVVLICYSYMSNNSSNEYRFIKFLAYEVAVTTADPLGTYLGGRLLGKGNHQAINGQQLRNYSHVYTTCLVAIVVGFLWVLLVINENSVEVGYQLINNDGDGCGDGGDTVNSVIDENGPLMDSDFHDETDEETYENNNKSKKIVIQKLSSLAPPPSPPPHKMDTKFSLSKMFDLNNVGDMFATAFKQRPNNGRTLIWLLYLCMCMHVSSTVGHLQVLFPYVEKVYHWDAQQFSNVKSIAAFALILLMAPIAFLMSGVLKVNDTRLAALGFLSNILAGLSIGLINSPVGLYIMYAIGSASCLISIGIRSPLSKLATEAESGKVFSLLAALETIMPTLVS
ncbi:uncharacterized protein LOC128956477 [Oppia nitens]|uniref:uncharacterized protein LOC128956477 n=1 Tax=Oppia nitens TaxID=1686743 RepID=UPI0023DC16FB|nr:uncharacterized protein LOC128956477 [Oppia nitens]